MYEVKTDSYGTVMGKTLIDDFFVAPPEGMGKV